MGSTRGGNNGKKWQLEGPKPPPPWEPHSKRGKLVRRWVEKKILVQTISNGPFATQLLLIAYGAFMENHLKTGGDIQSHTVQ